MIVHLPFALGGALRVHGLGLPQAFLASRIIQCMASQQYYWPIMGVALMMVCCQGLPLAVILSGAGARRGMMMGSMMGTGGGCDEI